MNRSILVVICDFMVLSMLSMVTNWGALANPYGEHAAVIDRRAVALVKSKMQQERTALLAARQAVISAINEHGDTPGKQAMLQNLQQQLTNLDKQIALLDKTPERGQKPVEQTAGAVVEYQQKLRAYQQALTAYHTQKKQLDHADAADLLKAQAELALRESALFQAQRDLAASIAKMRQMEQALAQARRNAELYKSQLESVEKSLTDLNGDLHSARQTLGEVNQLLLDKQAELTALNQAADELQTLLKSAVQSLASERELGLRRQQSLDKVERELRFAEQDVHELTGLLTADIVRIYQLHAVKLTCGVGLADGRKTSADFWTVPLKIGRRKVIAGYTGNFDPYWQSAGGEKISALSYNLAAPAAEWSRFDALYLSKHDPALALLALDIPELTALEVLDFESLLKRGLQDLFLFKTGSNRGGTGLDGRCTVSLSKKDCNLYINNAGAKVMAEPGDLVLTRAGQVAAVVLAVRRTGTEQEARAATFAAEFNWQDFRQLALDAVAAGGYENFGGALRQAGGRAEIISKSFGK